MKGDFSRSTFRRKKHYRKVNMQQGRVQLDSDWNEQVDINAHYERAALRDIIGESGTVNGSSGFSIIGNKEPIFTWDNILNSRYNDSNKLKDFLMQNFGVYWIEPLNFIKNDNDEKTINISDGTYTLSIELNDEKTKTTKAILKIDNKDVYEFIAKIENERLSIYQKLYRISAGHYYVDGILCENETEIDALRQPDMPLLFYQDIYLFRWDNIPGSDDNKLKEFLRQNFKVEALQFAKSDNERTVNISDGSHTISIELNEEKTRATIASLKINTNIAYEFTAKTENNRLNIYHKFNPVLPAETGTYLAYLDVWERHLSAKDDPDILESALGGADTTSRTKIVWQVKLIKAGNVSEINNYNCFTTLAPWDEMIKSSSGALQVRSTQQKSSKDPYILLPEAKYRGLENQLYRVEIHDPGEPGKGATFKWSRDNGMVVAGIKDISEAKLTVEDSGRDKLPGFDKGQWVEIIDDRHELWGIPGTFARLTEINEENIEQKTFLIDINSIIGDPLTNDNFPQEFNPKVRRWDSAGSVAVEIPSDNEGYIHLENGVEIKFAEGTYKANDYWLIPARAAKGDVEWPKIGEAPEALPPEGIKHHFCRIALLKYDNGIIETISDCRKFFPVTTALNGLSANTGIIMLTIRKHHNLLFGPFNHRLNDINTPPAIILTLAENPYNVNFDNDDSRDYIVEKVNMETFWVRALDEKSNVNEVKKTLRWWAIPALEKDVQEREPIPNIKINPRTIQIGKSAIIRVIDPEANLNPLVKDIIRINVKVSIPGENGTKSELGPIIIDVKENGIDSGIFQVQMDINSSSIEVNNHTIEIPSSLNLEANGGSIEVAYKPENWDLISDTADIPRSYIPELTTITVDPSGRQVVSGSTIDLKAELKDQFGKKMAGNVTWSSSNTNIGTIIRKDNAPNTATFTAKKVGQVTITATFNDISAEASLTVIPGRLTMIKIKSGSDQSGSYTVISGEKRNFEATGYDVIGNEIKNMEVTWGIEGDNSIGTITPKPDDSKLSEFEAKKATTSYITASTSDISGKAKVEVIPGTLASITIQSDQTVVKSNETITFTATCRDAKDNVITNLSLNWNSSDPDIGTIEYGRFTPNHKGTTTITSEKEGILSNSVTVTVTPGPLDTIEITTSDPITVPSNNSILFTATCKDAKGNEMTNLSLNWNSSDPDKGTIEDGRFTPNHKGTTTITANKDSIQSNPVTVTVIPGPLSQIEISPAGTLYIMSGTLKMFIATCMDSNGNTIENLTLEWNSSDTHKGTIDGNGEFKAIHVGITTITANKDRFSSNSVIVSVVPGAPKNIECEATEPTGTSSTITVTLKDINGNPRPGAQVKFQSQGDLKGNLEPETGETDGKGMVSTKLTRISGYGTYIVKVIDVIFRDVHYPLISCSVKVTFSEPPPICRGCDSRCMATCERTCAADTEALNAQYRTTSETSPTVTQKTKAVEKTEDNTGKPKKRKSGITRLTN